MTRVLLLALTMAAGGAARADAPMVREAVQVARELRGSDNLYDQIAGAGTLADTGDKDSLQFLVDLLQHPDQSLQRSAIDMLLDVQNPTAIDILYRLASMDQDGIFLKFVAESLASRPRGHLIELLMKALTQDDVWIKKHALQALAQVPLGDHAARIREIAQDVTQDAVSRATADYALLRTPYRDESLKELIRISVDGIVEAKEAAAVGLGLIDTAQAREVLHAMSKETDPNVKLAVLASEAGLGDKGAIADLTQLIANDDGMDGPTAAASLRRLPPAVATQITDELMVCCQLSPNKAARLVESWAWIDADPSRVYAWGLHHEDAGVRMQTVWLVGQRGERKVLDAVFPLLKDKDAGIRGMAAWTIVRLLGDE